MKKSCLYLLSYLTFVFILTSCGGDDDEPTVIPTADFSQDRNIVEVGEVVTFTNNSEDGESFEWNFGDNGTANIENPTHIFSTLGTFTVTLTVTSSSGDKKSSTSTVKVGKRIIAGALFESINFLNENGETWDDDGTGPDVLFGFLKATDQSLQLLTLGDDMTEDNFPDAGGLFPEAFQIELTNEDWNFILVDNDKPLDDINISEIMFNETLNPVTITSVKDYTTGQGVFVVNRDGFNFTVGFTVE